MDLKAIQAALLFGGQSGPGGDWAEAVCAPFTASGGTVVCSPLAGRALTVAAVGATTQAGGGTAAPGNHPRVGRRGGERQPDPDRPQAARRGKWKSR